jgi:hypothetical protein
MISLIVTSAREPAMAAAASSAAAAAAVGAVGAGRGGRGRKLLTAGPTLIVAPLSVVKTWEDQFAVHVDKG